MLESMLGPDVMNKIMAKLAALVCTILAWIGLIMVMMTAFVAKPGEMPGDPTVVMIHHAHLWPMLIAFFCGSAGLVIGNKWAKAYLSLFLMFLSFWVMLDTIMGYVEGPTLEGAGLAEAVVPLMAPVAAIGGFLGFLGGVVGILGALKFSKK